MSGARSVVRQTPCCGHPAPQIRVGCLLGSRAVRVALMRRLTREGCRKASHGEPSSPSRAVWRARAVSAGASDGWSRRSSSSAALASWARGHRQSQPTPARRFVGSAERVATTPGVRGALPSLRLRWQRCEAAEVFRRLVAAAVWLLPRVSVGVPMRERPRASGRRRVSECPSVSVRVPATQRADGARRGRRWRGRFPACPSPTHHVGNLTELASLIVGIALARVLTVVLSGASDDDGVSGEFLLRFPTFGPGHLGSGVSEPGEMG